MSCECTAFIACYTHLNFKPRKSRTWTSHYATIGADDSGLAQPTGVWQALSACNASWQEARVAVAVGRSFFHWVNTSHLNSQVESHWPVWGRALTCNQWYVPAPTSLLGWDVESWCSSSSSSVIQSTSFFWWFCCNTVVCGTSGPKISLSILSKSGNDEVGVEGLDKGDLGWGGGGGGGLVELDARGELGSENVQQLGLRNLLW